MPQKINNINILFLPLFFLPISIIIGQVAISITLLVSTIIFFIKIKNIEFRINFQNCSLLFFFLIMIISTFFNNNFNEKSNSNFFVNSLLYAKFLFLYLLTLNTKFNDYFFKNIKILFFLCIVSFFFVIFDTLFQYLHPLKIDIFGYKALASNANRLTGPFGVNEAIPGSYLFKISFIGLIFLNYYIYETYGFNKKLLILLILSINLLFFITILVTGERMSFLMILLSSLIFITLTKKLRWFFMLVGSLFFIIFFLIISTNPYIEIRYKILTKYFLTKDFVTVDEKKLTKEDYKKRNEINFLNNQWGAHYLTAVEMIKEKPFIGLGIKGFRKECSKSKYENIKSLAYFKRCSSHPHNLYFEILTETGFFGFVSIFIFFSFLTIKSFKLILILNKKNINSQDRIILSCFIATFAVVLTILWPIRSSGSFFSNLNGSMLWFSICLLNLFYRYFELKKDIYKIN
jgi:O-antigen ligase